MTENFAPGTVLSVDGDRAVVAACGCVVVETHRGPRTSIRRHTVADLNTVAPRWALKPTYATGDIDHRRAVVESRGYVTADIPRACSSIRVEPTNTLYNSAPLYTTNERPSCH